MFLMMEELFLNKQVIPSIVSGLLCFISAVYSLDLSSTTFVQRGGKFTLYCEVTGLEMHLWYKDGSPVVPNTENGFHLKSDSTKFSPQKMKYVTTMRLIVENADSIHSGEYKCNKNVSGFSQHVVVVTENLIETNEDEPGMGKILIPGERLFLQCITSECPHCTVVWFKDGERLHNSSNLVISEKNNSLTVRHSSYNDTGVYTCGIDRQQLDVALNATIVVQSKIKLEKFDQSGVVVEGSPLELLCNAKAAPNPFIKWFIGGQEVFDDDERVKLLDHEGLKKGKLFIEESNFDDRNHYRCEAYNQVHSDNTTVFIRVKDKLAALWPFLGICAEVAILCSIIFIYERRKSTNQCDEPDSDLPTDNKRQDQKGKGHDVRQRK